MTTISIIGSGNMATAIGTRAAKHGRLEGHPPAGV
jgi:pyrroline-5-carboxylate reductase